MKVDVYPVGVLSEVRRMISYWRHPPPVGNRRAAASSLRWMWRGISRKVRDRKWRELKSYFNGYLAEPTPWPADVTRCGSGWTRQRALRSLRRQVRRPGVLWEEVDREIERMLRGR